MRLLLNIKNLQNIPSNSYYGKLIKECFSAPKGHIMVGADFDSLEDKISALTTKDPNKLIIYEQGYDSHSYRAYYYFREQMPDITLTEDVKHNLAQIKIIKEKYKHLRQLSKAPTFA